MSSLNERLRLIVITDAVQAAPRTVEAVVALALEGGAPAIQLREKALTVKELLPLARRLRAITRDAGALFFVNDRVDVALLVEADGVHLGPQDVPVAVVRGIVPEGFLVGYSTDDPSEASAAEAAGADYLGTGAVWPTPSKPDAGTVIGTQGLARIARSVSIPVVGIGGITAARAASLPGTGAAGMAVLGAVMGSPDPGTAVRQLLAAFRS